MRQFTIRGLMVLIAITAVVLGLLEESPLVTVVTLYVAGLAFVAWLPSRGRSKVAAWGFFASAAWLNLSMLTLFAYHPVFHNSILLFLSSIAFIAIVPGVGLAWVANHPQLPQRIRGALAVIVLTAIPCSMIATRWPLALAFYLSSPGLGRLADRVESGGKVMPGEWAGIYRVWGAMVDPKTGDPVLLLDTDPSGISAFRRRIRSEAGREWLDAGGWEYIDRD